MPINESSLDSTTSTMESNNTLGDTKTAVIKTEKGDIHVILYVEEMPVTTRNFMDLAESGFYDGLIFHRVVDGFVIQGGDPKGDGTGGSDETIVLETSPKLGHEKGMLGMARKPNDKNSASSQFYITLDDVHQLDGDYAVFGRVTEGMDVAESIEKGDRINQIEVE